MYHQNLWKAPFQWRDTFCQCSFRCEPQLGPWSLVQGCTWTLGKKDNSAILGKLFMKKVLTWPRWSWAPPSCWGWWWAASGKPSHSDRPSWLLQWWCCMSENVLNTGDSTRRKKMLQHRRIHFMELNKAERRGWLLPSWWVEPLAVPLLEGDESGAVGGTNTGPTVLHLKTKIGVVIQNYPSKWKRLETS